ncbi:hypothetical protein KDM41_12470, partial [bacterium]|nr:hypothetical protein [bacterium]
PVRRQLDLFDGRAERIGEAVRQSGSEEARRRYDEALAQRERAAAHHRAGETDLALRRIRAAHDLLDQAADLAR